MCDSRLFFGLYTGSMALLAAAFAILGWVVPAAMATAVAGWSAARLVVAGVRVRITEKGIDDHNYWYSPGLISWDDIVEVREGRWGTIEIDLRDERAFWNRLGPLKQLARIKFPIYGLGPAAIWPWSLAGSRREMILCMQDALDTVTVRTLTQNPEPGTHSPDGGPS